ncbi:MAG: hypothetical protein PHP45_08880 [Elusimicrobiales bacterium]|nr:hypothetical protein [Elusimicrobiales bacterium]
MRYWIYNSGEIEGPLEVAELGTKTGFGPASLVSPETASGEADGDWLLADSVPEIAGALFGGPSPQKQSIQSETAVQDAASAQNDAAGPEDGETDGELAALLKKAEESAQLKSGENAGQARPRQAVSVKTVDGGLPDAPPPPAAEPDALADAELNSFLKNFGFTDEDIARAAACQDFPPQSASPEERGQSGSGKRSRSPGAKSRGAKKEPKFLGEAAPAWIKDLELNEKIQSIAADTARLGAFLEEAEDIGAETAPQGPGIAAGVPGYYPGQRQAAGPEEFPQADGRHEVPAPSGAAALAGLGELEELVVPPGMLPDGISVPAPFSAGKMPVARERQFRENAGLPSGDTSDAVPAPAENAPVPAPSDAQFSRFQPTVIQSAAPEPSVPGSLAEKPPEGTPPGITATGIAEINQLRNADYVRPDSISTQTNPGDVVTKPMPANIKTTIDIGTIAPSQTGASNKQTAPMPRDAMMSTTITQSAGSGQTADGQPPPSSTGVQPAQQRSGQAGAAQASGANRDNPPQFHKFTSAAAPSSGGAQVSRRTQSGADAAPGAGNKTTNPAAHEIPDIAALYTSGESKVSVFPPSTKPGNRTIQTSVMLGSANTADATRESKKRGPGSRMVILILVIALAAVAGGGMYFFLKDDKAGLKQASENAKKPAPAPAEPPPQPPAAPPQPTPQQSAAIAVDIAKNHDLGGGRGTIAQWLRNAYAANDGQEDWSATALHNDIYVAQYRFRRPHAEPVVYQFEVDAAAGRINRGINNAAIELLQGPPPPAPKPVKKKPVRRKKPARRPQLPLPKDPTRLQDRLLSPPSGPVKLPDEPDPDFEP